MRNELCQSLVDRSSNPDMIFLTGDLGFMALEPLRDALGERFVNAGVAEQNMVTVSAALARQGFEVWTYSIAPFCYARGFEQIRNDVSFHGLPVNLIGNGGGYGYGVMGPTHHAIEDYGVLSSFEGIDIFIPVFDQDVPAVVVAAAATQRPTYLRLGRGEAVAGSVVPPYAPWRRLTDGDGPTVVAVGPLAGGYANALAVLPPAQRPQLWAVAQLPIERNPPPRALVERIGANDWLYIAEEHVSHGGFGEQFTAYLVYSGVNLRNVKSLHALKHVYEAYGSQRFLRERSQIDARAMLALLQA
jgi:transketolase